ncbi:MAG: signal peptidase II [Pirellulaceae bacterium]|nr:signal peptidase II [Pirellulaceae bacterium]
MIDTKDASDRFAVQVAPVRRLLLFAAVAGLGCALDLFSKHLVFQWRGMPGELPVWWLYPDLVGIETSLNTGALFGLGQDKVIFLAVFSFVALFCLLIWFIWGGGGRDLFLTLILACVTGGILGNLYDRLGLWEPTFAVPANQQMAEELAEGGEFVYARNAVRDWIRLSYGRFVWPNFNVADCLLVCGAVALIWHSFQTSKNQKLGSVSVDSPNSEA